MCGLPPVIRARVREVRNRGLEPTAVVEVKEVLKSSLVNIPKETQTLYYSSSCLCPPLVPGEEYIIMGYENEERSRWGRFAFLYIRTLQFNWRWNRLSYLSVVRLCMWNSGQKGLISMEVLKICTVKKKVFISHRVYKLIHHMRCRNRIQ